MPQSKFYHITIKKDPHLITSDSLFFFLLFPSFDNQFLARAILVYGTDFKITLNRNGHVEEVPLIQKSPSILLRDSNSPVTISFRFNCPDKLSCKACSLTNEQKRQLTEMKKPIPVCDYTRHIKLVDSYW